MTVDSAPSRRRVLLAGAAGFGAIVVAACSSATKKAASSANPPASTGSSTGSSTSTAAGTPLTKLSAVPVGGAVAATAGGKPMIVSQPTAGRVVCFSAICTHMGCTVAPAGKVLQCPCHGSVYDAATGAVKGGPAPRPLPKIAVHVASGEVVTGT